MPKKKLISMRVDKDVLGWFQARNPSGYQTSMHQVLSMYVTHKLARENQLVGRAQAYFEEFYTQCFWHFDPKLKIGLQEVELVIEGLRKYGGRRGFLLAAKMVEEQQDAYNVLSGKNF